MPNYEVLTERCRFSLWRMIHPFVARNESHKVVWEVKKYEVEKVSLVLVSGSYRSPISGIIVGGDVQSCVTSSV
jgi:hypothetical protein